MKEDWSGRPNRIHVVADSIRWFYSDDTLALLPGGRFASFSDSLEIFPV
jgi:hypothetical protein